MEKTITLAGGCFWGLEKFLGYIKGVVSTEAGYANGQTENPIYNDVCRLNTGHAEVVKVVYDSSIISLPYLLSVFYSAIDPTMLNRQGNDDGTQYRTGIYYSDPEDKPLIDSSLMELQKKISKPIVVECLPLENYYPAEEYHQKYLDKNPEGYCHIGASEFLCAKNAEDLSKTK